LERKLDEEEMELSMKSFKLDKFVSEDDFPDEFTFLVDEQPILDL